MQLPQDVLRLVLGAALGTEQRRDAYVVVRELQDYALVCRAWREAVASTPIKLNLDYKVELPFAARRWLQRMTIADLEVNPSGCWGAWGALGGGPQARPVEKRWRRGATAAPPDRHPDPTALRLADPPPLLAPRCAQARPWPRC